MTNQLKTIFNNTYAQVTSCKITNGTLPNTTVIISKVSNSSMSDGNESIEVLDIHHENCKAKLSLYGGQVLSFEPTGHQDVFWLSKQAKYGEEVALRGGVPICWPWFGPFDYKTHQEMVSSNSVGENSSPVNKALAKSALDAIPKIKHGFARLNSWTLSDVSADNNGVTIVLTLTGANVEPLWPTEFLLTQTLFFGSVFKQSLSMTNLSKEHCLYSLGLHNYFAVSNPKNVSIDALTGVEYFDQLTQEMSQQKTPVSCVGEIDRKYLANNTMALVDQKWQRKINIESNHCQEWVLWNPGSRLAKTMSDVHTGGEHEYVCLEPATTAWQLLAAGETATVSQQIKVESC